MDLNFVGVALAIGVTGLGVTICQGLVAREAIEAQGKNPDLAGTLRTLTILGLALVESAAIYGLVVAILILQKVGVDGFAATQGLAAGLAIALPGFAAGLGQGMIVINAIKAVLRNPADTANIRTNMIIFIALVESAAIYGLVTAILILNK
ncbi:MAG: ATP synthase F0 subunit C [Candidatus Absconditabacterales bacterium]|nr:ATP synthase F0 subunit C [Candidatus Absconditabacterales bacterium]